MPRRIPNYPKAFEYFNQMATCGLFIATVSLCIFFFVFLSAEYENKKFTGFTKLNAHVYNPIMSRVR